MLIPQFPVSFLPLFFNLNCGALKSTGTLLLPAASSEVQQYDPYTPGGSSSLRVVVR